MLLMADHPEILWTEDLENQVIEGILSERTLRAVSQKCGISCASIIKRTVVSPPFGEQYARAMQIRDDAKFAELDDLQSEVPQETMHGVDAAWVNWRRLQIDTLKWWLSKRQPKKYGERTTLAGDPEQPLAFVARSILDEPPKK